MSKTLLKQVIPFYFLPTTTPWAAVREQEFESLPYTSFVCVTCLGPLEATKQMGQCHLCMAASRAIAGPKKRGETHDDHHKRVGWGLSHLWNVKGYVAPYLLTTLLQAQDLINEYASPQDRFAAWTEAGIPSTAFWLHEFIIPVYDEWVAMEPFDRKNASVVRREASKCGCCGRASAKATCKMCDQLVKQARRNVDEPHKTLSALSYLRTKPGHIQGLPCKYLDTLDKMVRIEAEFRRSKLPLRDSL